LRNKYNPKVGIVRRLTKGFLKVRILMWTLHVLLLVHYIIYLHLNGHATLETIVKRWQNVISNTSTPLTLPRPLILPTIFEFINDLTSIRCTHNPTSQKIHQTIEKKIKIREIFMFFHLKPWKPWQVVACSFIWMLRNSNQKSIW